LHAAGLALGAFTINDKVQAERLRRRGIDYLFTDRPDRLRGGP
jgi:glycerophosphoryl diester phosphodiesterase